MLFRARGGKERACREVWLAFFLFIGGKKKKARPKLRVEKEGLAEESVPSGKKTRSPRKEKTKLAFVRLASPAHGKKKGGFPPSTCY